MVSQWRAGELFAPVFIQRVISVDRIENYALIELRDTNLPPSFLYYTPLFGGQKEARQAILISMKRSQFYRTLQYLFFNRGTMG